MDQDKVSSFTRDNEKILCKQGPKRPLDTPERKILRRERERERETITNNK